MRVVGAATRLSEQGKMAVHVVACRIAQGCGIRYARVVRVELSLEQHQRFFATQQPAHRLAKGQAHKVWPIVITARLGEQRARFIAHHNARRTINNRSAVLTRA